MASPIIEPILIKLMCSLLWCPRYCETLFLVCSIHPYFILRSVNKVNWLRGKEKKGQMTSPTIEPVLIELIERMRTSVQEAFSYGIQHTSLWFNEVWPYASLNHNEIMPYPVWKCVPYRSTHPPYRVPVLMPWKGTMNLGNPALHVLE